ncbi:hypothetical protein LXA43DRAFT_1068453 [Ganoderma leucocontextum]|nr:hypothetical protein LXA43DRAFT_1068453 [Ganoderma leucocontextum]
MAGEQTKESDTILKYLDAHTDEAHNRAQAGKTYHTSAGSSSFTVLGIKSTGSELRPAAFMSTVHLESSLYRTSIIGKTREQAKEPKTMQKIVEQVKVRAGVDGYVGTRMGAADCGSGRVPHGEEDGCWGVDGRSLQPSAIHPSYFCLLVPCNHILKVITHRAVVPAVVCVLILKTIPLVLTSNARTVEDLRRSFVHPEILFALAFATAPPCHPPTALKMSAAMNPTVRREVRTFHFGKMLYTVVNPSVVEPLPGLTLAEPKTLDASEIRKALCTIKCPELAYAPRHHDFTGNLLEQLNCRVNDLPLMWDTQWMTVGWKLNGHTTDVWYKLEKSLYYIIGLLEDHTHNFREKLTGLDLFGQPPSSCGYPRCSMAMALTMGETPTDPPAWVCILSEKGVDEEWINKLCQSWISDFSRDVRTGAVIETRPGEGYTPWIQHIPCMVHANLPVYIRWCSFVDGAFHPSQIDDILTVHQWLCSYRPDLEQNWAVPDDGPALIYCHQPWKKSWATHFQWSMLEKPINWTLPGLPRMIGPTVDQQMVYRNRVQPASEDYFAYKIERREWEGHVEKARSFEKPNYHTKVWLWTQKFEVEPWCDPDEQNVWIHHQVGRSKVATLWENYPNTQKEYDVFADAWHICAALTPAKPSKMTRRSWKRP